MKISIFSGRTVVALGALVLLTVFVYGIVASRVPFDSPKARMYRTEADMALLAHAVEVYHADFDRYPLGGVEGLEVAVDHFTDSGRYMPEGVPPDGWRRPFVYVPHGEYAEAGSLALKTSGGYIEPGGYQLYSLGADGEAGLDGESGRGDNIVSWSSGRSWRRVYAELQGVYYDSRRGIDED